MSRTRLYHALLLAALATTPHAAHALRVDYVVDLIVERNDNLLLTPDDPIALTILRPGLGFDVVHDSSTLQTRISGRAEYRHYGDDRFGDVEGYRGATRRLAAPPLPTARLKPRFRRRR